MNRPALSQRLTLASCVALAGLFTVLVSLGCEATAKPTGLKLNLEAQEKGGETLENAPDLTGGVAWLNTAGPLTLKDVRGKIVQGKRGWTVLVTIGKPMASARPRTWLVMPARPSEIAQVTFSTTGSFTVFRSPVILLLKSPIDRAKTVQTQLSDSPGRDHAADQT